MHVPDICMQLKVSKSQNYKNTLNQQFHQIGYSNGFDYITFNSEVIHLDKLFF